MKVKFFVVYFCIVILFCSISSCIAKTLNDTQSLFTLKKQFKNFFSFSTTTTWKEYVINSAIQPFKYTKWAWLGLINFKSKNPLHLKELRLTWKGDKLKTLTASLYQKKESDSNLIPVPDNFICDGQWDVGKQELLFDINRKIISSLTYYLLLNFPAHEEVKLRHGEFTLMAPDALLLKNLR
jgi:hypothetical protein